MSNGVPDGPGQFNDWMRRRGFTQADASRYLGMEPPYVNVLANGKRSPGLVVALRLERLTGIPVEAWVSSEVDESDAQTAGPARNGHV